MHAIQCNERFSEILWNAIGLYIIFMKKIITNSFSTLPSSSWETIFTVNKLFDLNEIMS